LDKYEKLKLIDGLESKVMAKGEPVFNEGDAGDNFYIIEEGEVECLKKKDDLPFNFS
jgi:CRP-like cAMP-binding protein